MGEASRQTDSPSRVVLSTLEVTRRVIFSALEGVLPARMQARLAGAIAAELREAHVLDRGFEPLYSAAMAGELVGGRSAAWALKHARLGHFGPCGWDDGVLIPASGLQRYFAKRLLEVAGKKGAAMGERRGENVSQSMSRRPPSPLIALMPDQLCNGWKWLDGNHLVSTHKQVAVASGPSGLLTGAGGGGGSPAAGKAGIPMAASEHGFSGKGDPL